MRVGPEHADRAEVLAVDDDRGDDHRARRQRLDAVLDADRHRHPAVDDVAHEGHDDELLLERVQDVAHDLDGVERAGHPRRAADVDVVVAGDLPDRVEGAAAHGVDDGVAARADLGRRHRRADERAGEMGRRASATVASVVSAGSSTIWFSTVPLPRTTTTVACWFDSPTSWMLRIVAASVLGPTTTAA